MARAANREAMAHLEQALGALRRLPETRETTELTIDLRIDLRNALVPLGEWARMGEHLHEAEGLARTLGDPHRLARIATFMVTQCRTTGDYDEAVRFGQEALSLARTLGDRSIEVVATSFLGITHFARGEFSAAATLLERNVALEGDLRAERFGTAAIQSALSGAYLAEVLSELGRFDEAIGHAEAAVRIAEAADHPLTLYFGLFGLGRAHLRRGDLPRATRVLERGLDLCRTWQFVLGTPFVAATLGAAYALAGRADEALPLVAGAVEEFRRRPTHTWPALILLCAGMTSLSAGRIDEAASHAREALALSRRLGARASEAHALCLAGDVASAGGAEDAEGYYREALALAGELGMRPLVAHCHLGLGKLYRRTGQRRAGAGAPHHRDDDVPRDGHGLLAGAGGGGAGAAQLRHITGGCDGNAVWDPNPELIGQRTWPPDQYSQSEWRGCEHPGDGTMSTTTTTFVATDPAGYERFMERWSQRLAPSFVEFAGVQAGERALDVGCGTGSLTLALMAAGVAAAVGVDPSSRTSSSRVIAPPTPWSASTWATGQRSPTGMASSTGACRCWCWTWSPTRRRSSRRCAG